MRIKSAAVRSSGKFGLLLAAIFYAGPHLASARQSAMAVEAREQPFIVEYYYKPKWGYADEFLELFKKNHYPVLKKQMEMGRILKVTMATPRYHATEDWRWDFRVTVVFKNAAIANDDSFDTTPLIKQLYPNQKRYKKEEQRRFEILESHWDVPIEDVDLDVK